MKRLTISILVSLFLTISSGIIGYFIIGIELLTFPITIILFLIGLSGLITIPTGLIKVAKGQFISNHLISWVGLAIGFYFGWIIVQPINSWDERQRNYSGSIITKALEDFKEQYDKYPDDLHQLDITKLNEELPKTYKIDRFTYRLDGNDYDLDIPIPIMDRWHWSRDKSEFEYNDF